VDHITFLSALQQKVSTIGQAVADTHGDWIVKGFIDIYRKIYTVSVDTKVISKVLELLLFPELEQFADEYQLSIQLAPQQNFYPDLTLTSGASGVRFALDVKSTYRVNADTTSGMTLGAFTGYFRNRQSSKNTLYPYATYAGHFVLGVIYSKNAAIDDERQTYTLEQLASIPAVIRDFTFFAQPKYAIASDRPGSGNTKNIGSVTSINALVHGQGPFAQLGEEVYDDYWQHYLTKDMAVAIESQRPYTNLTTYLTYKERGLQALQAQRQALVERDDEDGIGEVV